MADYYPLIARAVAGLENSTGEARRAMYERARSALIAQLRSVEPALSESDITRERLALEEAVRKVEAEAAQRIRSEPTKSQQAANAQSQARAEASRADSARADSRPASAPVSRPGDALRAPMPTRASSSAVSASSAPQPGRAGPRPSAPPLDPANSMRSRAGMPPVRPKTASEQALRGIRDAVAEADTLGGAAAQANRSARRSFSAVPAPAPSQFDRVEPNMESRGGARGGDDEQTYYNDTTGEAMRPTPLRPRSARPEQQAPSKVKRSAGRLLKTLTMIGLVLVLIGGGVLAWPRVRPLLAMFTSSPITSQKAATPGERPKIPDRVGQLGSQVAPVAQRVVLYDEEPGDSQGKQHVGTVVWRLDTVPGGANQQPDIVVRADVEIPTRKFKMSFSIRRNNDPGLPASHTAELSFQLPPDFEGGSVANVPGILMKQTEQTRGTPLAGLAVKVTDGFFLIGLSNVDADRQRNIQLMKDRAWFDVPMVYANQRRAILAVEKGAPGERAFADAFQAWGQ